MSEIKNPAVLITGSTKGIGFAIAEEFAKNNYQVILNGRHENKEALARIQSYSPSSIFIACDVSKEEEVEKLFKTLKENKIELDVLLCDSGISKDSLLLRLKPEDLEKILDINLKSAFYTSKQAARLMLKKKKGSILFTSSVVGIFGHEGQCAYAASKAGLIGLMKSLAKELAAKNIRVNAIAPGWIETDMTKDIPLEKMPAIPMKRGGKPEEVAKAAYFLAGEASSYITGQVLQIDGGMGM